MSSKFKNQQLFLAMATILGTTTHAYAQDSSKKDVQELDGIVVTSQKRVERLQDVPLAVTAVSSEKLEAMGINSSQDLRYVAPSLNYQSSVNARGEGFAVRGIGTAIFSDTVEQSVGVVIDGVPLSRPGQALADLIDIDQVEILRGPQGMLFGKNASAGVISISTRQPEFNNSLQARVSYGSQNESKLSAIGNLKLSDTMALRVGYGQTKRDGFVTNIERDELLNGRDSKGVRMGLLWEATPNLTVNLRSDWGKSDQLCCAWTARTAPDTSTFGLLNAAEGIIPGEENRIMAGNAPFYQNTENWGASLQVDFDAGWGTFTSISAYRYWKTSDTGDADILPLNFLEFNGGSNWLDQYSQEFRLTSPSGGRFEWVAGTFLSHIENRGLVEAWGNRGQVFPNTDRYYGSATDSVTTNKSVAVFGQLSYALSEKMKLIVGGRYTSEELDFVGEMYTMPTSVAGTPGRFIGPIQANTSVDNFSGKAALQYYFNRDFMVYVSAARGYKGPGIDTQSIIRSDLTVIRPEIPTSYEIGMRSQFMDRAVTLNITGFATDFKDFQASVFDVNQMPARFLLSNAGKLRTRGVEAEFEFRPTADLAFNGSATYADSIYADFKNISCNPYQTVLPLGTPRTSPRECILITPTVAVTYGDGNPLSNAPKLTYSLSASYGRTMGDYRVDTFLNWFWRDEVSFDASGNPLMRQDAYGLLNANIGIGPEDGKWRLSLFARNILDKHFVNRVTGQGVYGGRGISVQWGSPDAERFVGVALDVRFGGL